MKHLTRLSALVLALGMASPILAAPPGPAESRIAAGTLPPGEIVRKLEAAGYTNIHDVEYDDGKYEAEALTASGARVELDIDPVQGVVTGEKAD